MRLSGFSSIITSMFKDKMSVYRYTSTVESNLSTSTARSTTPIIKDELCKLSFISDESPKDSSVDSTPIMTTPKLFCKASTVLLPGDYVIVTRVDDNGDVLAVYEGELGLPARYVTHQEVLFVLRGSA